MSNYTPLSALEPSGGSAAIESDQYHPVPKEPSGSGGGSSNSTSGKAGGAVVSDNVIDDIIAELNGGGGGNGARASDETTTLAAAPADAAPAAGASTGAPEPLPAPNAQPAPAHPNLPGLAYEDAYVAPQAYGGGDGRFGDDSGGGAGGDAISTATSSATSTSATELSLYDAEFWGIVARGLRDPLIVAVVVAVISSPQIQRRLGEFTPLLIGDGIQATLVRAVLAMLLYMGISRLL